MSFVQILIALVLLFHSTPYQELIDKAMKDQDRSLSSGITLFLCGDVMTGRGIDQILPNSVNPGIYESYVKDARVYVRLAETKNGPVRQPVSYSYIWGDAIKIWEQLKPAFKIINLETSITTHDQPWPGKGINYRMHPENIKVLTSAGIDFCSLANNHILDWDYEGLRETLQVLKNAGIAYAGAGINLNEAGKPVQLKIEHSEVIIFAFGSSISGVPENWAATAKRSGVNLLHIQDNEALIRIRDQVKSVKKSGNIVVFSIHWGDNWGYDIPDRQRYVAHWLIDNASVDIIHGHSSHHPRGIEVYKDKLIIYGAGDFINDYEGISGYEHYRDDLTLMYFPTIDPSNGRLISMRIVPMQIKNLRLNQTSYPDTEWLFNMLNREGRILGTSVSLIENRYFTLHWDHL